MDIFLSRCAISELSQIYYKQLVSFEILRAAACTGQVCRMTSDKTKKKKNKKNKKKRRARTISGAVGVPQLARAPPHILHVHIIGRKPFFWQPHAPKRARCNPHFSRCKPWTIINARFVSFGDYLEIHASIFLILCEILRLKDFHN